MTPKEKAESLTSIFYDNIGLNAKTSVEQLKYEAKQCALICVDEILNTKPTHLDNDTIDFFLNTETIRFYKQVKTEIEKL